MTDQEIAQAAAERWGCKDPSFEDVINEHVPKYGKSKIHVQRWHRIADMAYDIAVPTQRCEWCDKILYGKTQGKRRYCDASCASKAYRERNE